jgi:CHASE1-domain containing sensor protein
MTKNGAGEKQGPSNLGRVAPYLMLAMMLALSIGLWRFWDKTEQAKAQKHFNEYCEQISQDLTVRFFTYTNILLSSATLFLGTEEVTREMWRMHYEYRQVGSLFPGFHGIGFTKLVQSAELAQHIERIRAGGLPEYAVWPYGQRLLYAPAIFAEPFNVISSRAIGYDSWSEPTRRAAMEQARDTASVTMSGRLRLVTDDTETDVQLGYMIYVPVFASGVPPSDVEARRVAITGFVHGVLRVPDLIRSILTEPPDKVAFQLYDGTASVVSCK